MIIQLIFVVFRLATVVILAYIQRAYSEWQKLEETGSFWHCKCILSLPLDQLMVGLSPNRYQKLLWLWLISMHADQRSVGHCQDWLDNNIIIILTYI